MKIKGRILFCGIQQDVGLSTQTILALGCSLLALGEKPSGVGFFIDITLFNGGSCIQTKR